MKSFLLSNLGIAQAAVGFGWCTLEHTPQVEEFDREKFVGNWYEIYADYNMYNFFRRECSVSTYTPDKLSNKVDAMFVERKFNDKLWASEEDEAA
jgi:lipocalin